MPLPQLALAQYVSPAYDPALETFPAPAVGSALVQASDFQAERVRLVSDRRLPVALASGHRVSSSRFFRSFPLCVSVPFQKAVVLLLAHEPISARRRVWPRRGSISPLLNRVVVPTLAAASSVSVLAPPL